MKKALSLVEVLVAIMLLSVVIAAMLKIKSNNLFLLDKFASSAKNNSYIAMSVDTKPTDKKIYLDSIVKTDDKIRRELKKHIIIVKVDDNNSIKLPSNDYVPTAKIIKAKYTLDNSATKIFYQFKLEYK